MMPSLTTITTMLGEGLSILLVLAAAVGAIVVIRQWVSSRRKRVAWLAVIGVATAGGIVSIVEHPSTAAKLIARSDREVRQVMHDVEDRDARIRASKQRVAKLEAVARTTTASLGVDQERLHKIEQRESQTDRALDALDRKINRAAAQKGSKQGALP